MIALGLGVNWPIWCHIVTNDYELVEFSAYSFVLTSPDFWSNNLEVMSDVTFNFTGKKALVTGGSKGIGRDIVRALAEAKCEKIYVIARTVADLEKLKNDFPCVETISLDIKDWDATRKAVEQIEPVDFLVNNAATLHLDNLDSFKPDEFDDHMITNVKAVLNISQIVCAKMLEKGSGSVVNMSSLCSNKCIRDTFVYTASKCALDGITKNMAIELAPKVRVNSVLPNTTLTEMGALWAEKNPETLKVRLAGIPMARLGTVEDTTYATLFLLSNAAAMTTGHCFSVTGGE